MKTNRPNTPETTVTNNDTTDMDKKGPLSVKVCERFGLSCSFCKQNVSHPSPQESDWSEKNWTGGHMNTQKQTGETNLLSHWGLPKSQSNPNSKTEVDKLSMDQLCLEHDNAQEEKIQGTNSMIPPPRMDKEEKATTEEKIDVGTNSNQQREEEEYKL